MKQVEILDFRSDTVTRPSRGMLDAMCSAPVGDDVYGDDETVNKLQEEVAALFGKEAALFTSSGTMANQLAIASQTRPGDSVIIENEAHLALYEGGAAASLSGVQLFDLPLSGLLDQKSLLWRQQGLDIHSTPTKLLAIENTHNRFAGRVLPLKDLRQIVQNARALNLPVHCDGARIWNASVALGVPERDLVQDVTSVAVCFSKGLGAPVGSCLIGSKELVDNARRLRKRWGGGMRQVGVLAAAARYALKTNRALLRRDHEQAATFARELRKVLMKNGRDGVVDYPDPGTNIVYFSFGDLAAKAHVEALRSRGILLNAVDEARMRAVFHLDLKDDCGERLSRECDVCIKTSHNQ